MCYEVISGWGLIFGIMTAELASKLGPLKFPYSNGIEEIIGTFQDTWLGLDVTLER